MITLSYENVTVRTTNYEIKICEDNGYGELQIQVIQDGIVIDTRTY